MSLTVINAKSCDIIEKININARDLQIGRKLSQCQCLNRSSG